ncbi:MAG: 2-hydroxyacid dehydrogenase, partial [Hyphomicrobiaceae bacterium]
MPKPDLLMTGPMMPIIADQLEAAFTVHNLAGVADRDALVAKVGPSIKAVCTGGHTGVKTDAALIGKLPALRIISNFGVGYDSIDVAAAAKRGIIVTNTPDVLTEEVADTALGLLIMTVRELSKAESWLRAGEWSRKGDYRLTPGSLRDRSIGMVGLGRIGKAIARRCEAFGLPISYFARHRQADVSYRYYDSIVAMARDVDTLIVITPGGAATQNLINASVLEALGPRGVVVNLARGSVIDEPALIDALRKG